MAFPTVEQAPLCPNFNSHFAIPSSFIPFPWSSSTEPCKDESRQDASQDNWGSTALLVQVGTWKHRELQEVWLLLLTSWGCPQEMAPPQSEPRSLFQMQSIVRCFTEQTVRRASLLGPSGCCSRSRQRDPTYPMKIDLAVLSCPFLSTVEAKSQGQDNTMTPRGENVYAQQICGNLVAYLRCWWFCHRLGGRR
jgi:hypothetical protein